MDYADDLEARKTREHIKSVEKYKKLKKKVDKLSKKNRYLKVKR
jgi:hypothetical protein